MVPDRWAFSSMVTLPVRPLCKSQQLPRCPEQELWFFRDSPICLMAKLNKEVLLNRFWNYVFPLDIQLCNHETLDTLGV